MADCCMLYTLCKIEQFVLTIIKQRLLLLLLLFTSRKSHTGFPLLPKVVTSMTLNGIILHYFAISVDLGANYVKVVKVRCILLQQKCSAKNLVFVNI